MKARLACLTTLAALSLAACGADRGGAEVASEESALERSPGSKDPTPPPDAGTKDTSASSSGALPTMAPIPSATSCAPQRWDVVAQGRTCWDFAGRGDGGTWSVAPTFTGGSPAFRSTHCAITWTPDAPGCVAGNPYDEFAFSCAEVHSLTERTAECAANPAACASAPTTELATSVAFQAEYCKPIAIDGGSGGGYVGGCSSCGEVYGNMLYITNPFSSPVIATSVTRSDGTVQQLQFSGAPHSTFAVPLSGSYVAGTVPIWR